MSFSVNAMFEEGKHLYRSMMQNATIPFLCLMGLLLSASPVLRAKTPSSLDNTRSLIQEWVLTEKLISEEQAEWAEEEATLNNLIALMDSEMQSLQKKIALVEAHTSESDKKRGTLLEDEKHLKASLTPLGQAIILYEQSLSRMMNRLPLPLQNRLRAFVQKFPASEGTITVTLAKRLQNMVSLLAEIEKFNNSVTFESQIRLMPDGQKLQIDVLYFGLAGGYFLDKSGQRAGVLTPGDAAWSVMEKPELVEPIAKAIAIYQRLQPAEFVQLPIGVK